MAETGFLDLYTYKKSDCEFCGSSAREQTLGEVNKLINKYANEEISITVTGHSLGGAMATLNGYDIVESGANKRGNGRAPVPVGVFTFASPRVGNHPFRERLDKLGVKVLRVLNIHDIVPKVPGLLINDDSFSFTSILAKGWSYSHVGVELELNHEHSPYLQDLPDEKIRDHIDDLANFHNLEAHLHLVDGYHGKWSKFELVNGRDIALVNKSADFVKDEYMIPPNWRQGENKGLTKTEDGKWVQPTRPEGNDGHI